jgi:DNA replication protein DnaC
MTLICTNNNTLRQDATIADALLDRIMQRNHRFTLTGDSLRVERLKTAKKEKNIDAS